MKNLCTVSDINYLIKGLTLYESLLKNTSSFKLNYLCIDDECYNKIIPFQNESLKIYNVNDFINFDKKLEKLKNDDYKYFCWALASYFMNYLMTQLNEPISYIDSDIYFYHSFNEVLNEIKTEEIILFRHRQFNLDINRPEGKFNVGVIHFNNTFFGKKALSWWSDSVLNKTYPHLATCGDQKYLDELLNICPEETILIDGNIGHGAPWHWQLYDLSSFHEDGYIKWDNKKQKLIFTHFSQFTIINDGNYIPSTMHHIYTPINEYHNNKNLKLIYDNYFKELNKTKQKYYG